MTVRAAAILTEARRAQEIARFLDEATIHWCLLTSSFAAIDEYVEGEACGIPAYDQVFGAPSPREVRLVCPTPGCWRSFWTAKDGQVYCSIRCQQRAAYWRRRATLGDPQSEQVAS